MYRNSNVTKIICKQNNMEANEHVNIEIRKKTMSRNYNVNKIICKHRNTTKKVNKLICKPN